MILLEFGKRANGPIPCFDQKLMSELTVLIRWPRIVSRVSPQEEPSKTKNWGRYIRLNCFVGKLRSVTKWQIQV